MAFNGAVGASGRLSYTVHGDAVNLAARLEALNKHYGTRVIVAESTAALVDGFELEELDETPVRGQSKPRMGRFGCSRAGRSTLACSKP